MVTDPQVTQNVEQVAKATVMFGMGGEEEMEGMKPIQVEVGPGASGGASPVMAGTKALHPAPRPGDRHILLWNPVAGASPLGFLHFKLGEGTRRAPTARMGKPWSLSTSSFW